MNQTWVQWFQWALFLLPWSLLIFLDKRKVRRYMPVTFLSIILVVLCYQLARNMGWFYATPNIILFSDLPAKAFGVYAIGTLLIFYFTFHRFWLFFFTNLALDIFQLTIVSPFYIKIGLLKNGTWDVWQKLALMTFLALLLYLYQRWQDDIMT